MKKVLIIDDTKNIRLLLTKCLEIEGYAVDCAADGKEGLERILKGSYDLIFLDIKLPEVSGTEVLRRMRGAGIKTPVMIITAYPTIKNAVDCIKLGAQAYLQKPFTAERLMTVIKDFWQKEEQLTTEFSQTELMANEAMAQGDFDRAITLIEQRMAGHMADSRMYRLLSLAYMRKGDERLADLFLRTAKIFEE